MPADIPNYLLWLIAAAVAFMTGWIGWVHSLIHTHERSCSQNYLKSAQAQGKTSEELKNVHDTLADVKKELTSGTEVMIRIREDIAALKAQQPPRP